MCNYSDESQSDEMDVDVIQAYHNKKRAADEDKNKLLKLRVADVFHPG